MQVTSNTETIMTAHETWRAGCEDDFLTTHDAYFEPREKIHVCGSAYCTQV